MKPSETEARAEEVRAFIEQIYSDLWVMEIQEHATTLFARFIDGRAFPVAKRIEFSVNAKTVSPTKPSVQCKVLLLEDGSFDIFDEQYTYPAGDRK